MKKRYTIPSSGEALDAKLAQAKAYLFCISPDANLALVQFLANGEATVPYFTENGRLINNVTVSKAQLCIHKTKHECPNLNFI